jgi:hypothetical protein
MGARLLMQWIKQPLLSVDAIGVSLLSLSVCFFTSHILSILTSSFSCRFQSVDKITPNCLLPTLLFDRACGYVSAAYLSFFLSLSV